MNVLPQMTKFLEDNKGNSLISRVYGVYQIKYPGITSITLMLQKNTVKPRSGGQILYTFDLKGSKYQRQALENTKL